MIGKIFFVVAFGVFFILIYYYLSKPKQENFHKEYYNFIHSEENDIFLWEKIKKRDYKNN